MNWFVSAEEMAEHRADAESRMGAINDGSDARVRRRTGRKIQNEITGIEEPEWTTVHAGPMRLAGAGRGSSGSRTEPFPGGEIRQGLRRADFPAAVTTIRDGDLVDITAGKNAGTVWRIVEADWADQQTARRLPVVAVQRPSEWGA